MGLYDWGLLVGEGLLLRLAELLDETHGLALETALEPPAGTRMDNLWQEDHVYEDGVLHGLDVLLHVTYLNELRRCAWSEWNSARHG